MSPIYGQPLSAQQFQYQLSRTPVPSRFSRQRGSHRSNIRISYGDDDDEIPLPQEKLTQQHAPNVSSAVLCAVPAYPQSQPVAANRTALNLDINHRSGALIDQTRGRQVQPLEIPESPQAFRETVAGMHQPLAPNKLHPSARLDSDNSTLQKILQEKRRSLKQPSQSSGIQRIDDSQPVNNIGLSIIRPKRGLFGAFRRKLPASLQNENVIVPYVAWLHGDDRKLTVISITDQDSESTSHCPRTELVAQQGPVSPTPSKSPERTRLPRLGSPELGIDVSRIVDSQAAAESDEEPPSKRITKRLRRPKRPLVIDDQQAAAPQDANRNDVPSDNAVECLDVANASQENAENEERTSKRQRHRKRRLPVNELELTEELHQVPSPVRTMCTSPRALLYLPCFLCLGRLLTLCSWARRRR